MRLLSYIRFAGDGTVRKHASDRERWLLVVSIAFVLTRPIYGEILETEINPANGHTYHLLDLALDDPDALNTWEEMEEAAVSMGGHLVTLNDAEEEEWIDDTFLPTISNAFFIGLNDLDEEGTFVWTSGEPVTYLNWQPGEPNNAGGFENIVKKEYCCGHTGDWNDATDRTTANGLVEIAPAARSLQAGDADQDLDFDQLDLVQVQIAAKYLTGQPATWGEGDWDGAPGGEPGNPPAGDSQFNQLDIIAALNAGTYLTGPYAAINKGGVRNDGQTSIVYDPNSGELAVDSRLGTELTSVNIDSASGIFTGAAAENLGGSFDNDSDNNIFKATFGSSFGSLSFGLVAQTGLSEDFVANDLTVVGSLAGGGDLGNVDLIYVPVPSTLVLLTLGLVGLVAYGFGQRSQHVT